MKPVAGATKKPHRIGRACAGQIVAALRQPRSEPLLQVSNHHYASSGDPPIINDRDGKLYVGYFENCHGEQWVFTFDREAEKASLLGGDIGWNTAIDVSPEGNFRDLTLDAPEKEWLLACLKACFPG